MERRLRIIRITGLCALAFLLMGSYSIARPAIESLFLQAHGHVRCGWDCLLVGREAY